MIVTVAIALPWAPVRLAVLIGGTWKLLRRQPATQRGESEAVLLDQLAGRVRPRSCAPLLLMPTTAAVAYALMWVTRNSDSFLDVTYWGLIAAQMIGGGIAFVWAWRQARRNLVSNGQTRESALVNS